MVTFVKKSVLRKGANSEFVLLRLRLSAYAFAYVLLKTSLDCTFQDCDN